MIAGATRQRTIRGSMVMQRDRISGRGRIATPYRCQIFGNQPEKGAAGGLSPAARVGGGNNVILTPEIVRPQQRNHTIAITFS